MYGIYIYMVDFSRTNNSVQFNFTFLISPGAQFIQLRIKYSEDKINS